MTSDGLALPIGRALTAVPANGAVYGLRPDPCSLGGDVPFRVEVVEPTGSETHVLGRLGGTEVVGVFRERIGAGPGEEIGVSIDPVATHVFDAGTRGTDFGLMAGRGRRELADGASRTPA